MIVRTNSLQNDGNAGGAIDNMGTIVVEGNIINNSSIHAVGDTIRLSGDWINNGSYTATNSWVEMNGATQLITGSNPTNFDNLSLLGGNSTKRQTLNALVKNELRLNDAELATDVHVMHVDNPAVNSVTRNSGFVSSVGAGRFTRTTNSSAAYLFPTGSPSYLNPPSIFRPVIITPASNTLNYYSATLVKGDASADGWNVNTTDDVLCLVNPNFYHRLYQLYDNNSASITMHYAPATDGDWTDQAHWDTPNRWNHLGSPTSGNGLGFSTVTVNGVSDFQPEPFALARKKFTLELGPDIQITQGESVTLQPTHTAVNVASYNWTPPVAISCTDCEKPTVSPSANTQYVLTMADDAGCTATDAVNIIVNNPMLLMPTAFSPNGDGVNDKFRALNKDLTEYTLQIYNRWGELVFETTDPTDGWDGTYKDIEQPLGVYVWTCRYRISGQPKAVTAKGNVTLMR
ncbi:MAG: gliding motility-associated C-terminal domain-containing protein [Chitinophagales bacterium]|nr:gliding motility-associated C-terminal domain-containing protein [Chitinophagales bacterium]MDW8417868.1 gliding motility-associated C-terminal domain-containing protein [Chitinophagales bacterium]